MFFLLWSKSKGKHNITDQSHKYQSMDIWLNMVHYSMAYSFKISSVGMSGYWIKCGTLLSSFKDLFLRKKFHLEAFILQPDELMIKHVTCQYIYICFERNI